MRRLIVLVTVAAISLLGLVTLGRPTAAASRSPPTPTPKQPIPQRGHHPI
jgi:hypothetical protein